MSLGSHADAEFQEELNGSEIFYGQNPVIGPKGNTSHVQSQEFIISITEVWSLVEELLLMQV